MGKEPIKSHEDLEVYQLAFDAAMKIFELSRKVSPEQHPCAPISFSPMRFVLPAL
jgi:hypothetical protein